MARFTFSENEINTIDTIVGEIDAASHDLLQQAAADLKPTEREFVVSYVNGRLRSALEIGIMARALCEEAERRGQADERGVDHFLRSKAWLHNFGVTQTGDEYFYSLSVASGHRLVRAFDALVEIAQDRMFGIFDEEYQRLLASES